MNSFILSCSENYGIHYKFFMSMLLNNDPTKHELKLRYVFVSRKTLETAQIKIWHRHWGLENGEVPGRILILIRATHFNKLISKREISIIYVLQRINTCLKRIIAQKRGF